MKFYMKFILYLVIAAWLVVARADDNADFFKAVEIDAPQMVEGLLARGFDPNTRDGAGQVGLYLALKFGSTRVTEVLLSHRATQIDQANAVGETPLMMAALRGDVATATQLLARGARLNRDPGEWTPLHYAAAGPSTELVTLLLDRGAALEARSPNGTTPLMMAARYGAIDSADRLKAGGADLRARNQKQMDAAEFARGAGRDELAQRLTPR